MESQTMIGGWKSYLDIYLYVAAMGMLVVFGIPLLLAPVLWARAFRWHIPQHEHLIVYLGRCLGGVICVIAVFAFRVASTPAVQPFFFDLILGVFLVMILIHIYGAIRRIQPITETIEIIFWVLLLLVTLCFYPS